MNFHSFYYGYELINTNFYFLYAIIYIFLIWNREIASRCLRSIKKKYNDLQFCLPGEMTALSKNEYDFMYVM